MKTTIEKQNILQQPMGITLVALGAALVWVAFPFNPGKLALLAVFVLFVIGLRTPIWAVAALIFSQLSIPDYYVGPFSLRLLLLLLIGIVLWRAHTQEKIKLGKKAKWLLIPTIILIAIITASNLVNSSIDFAIKDFRYVITGLLIVIFIPAVVKNVKDLRLLGGVALVAMTISTIVALIQGFTTSGRVRGISAGTLEFSYILSAIFLVILGILIVEGIKKRNRRFLIPLVLMLPALYLTYTRSALVALAFGLVALFLFLKTRIRGEIILLALLGIAIFISVSGITEDIYFGARSQEGQQDSSVTRNMLWQAGLAIARDNLVLGIGGDQFKTVSRQYSSAIDLSLGQDRYVQYEIMGLGWLQIHNDFLRMLVYYGIFAFIAFLLIILVILRNCIEAFQITRQKFIKGLAIGLAAGLVSYCINAFYHNVLADFCLLWLIAGFSLALFKLAEEKKPNAQIHQQRSSL